MRNTRFTYMKEGFRLDNPTGIDDERKRVEAVTRGCAEAITSKVKVRTVCKLFSTPTVWYLLYIYST